MDINTNLGYSFSNFASLLEYMLEEKIDQVLVECAYWGAILPKQQLTIKELKKYIKIGILS